MKESIKSWLERLWVALPILAAFLFIIVLFILFQADPLEAFDAMWRGAFGNTSKTLSVVSFWVPLLLAATGLLVTFSAGLMEYRCGRPDHSGRNSRQLGGAFSPGAFLDSDSARTAGSHGRRSHMGDDLCRVKNQGKGE